MESRANIAVSRKASGKYNCAQAVASTYADIVGIDESAICNIANAFGVGMGNMEGTCGALVGAGMIIGMACGDRPRSMKAMRDIMSAFEARNGTTICKHLKGAGASAPRRACNDCVADAAALLEEKLAEIR